MTKALKEVLLEKGIEASDKQIELFEGYRHLLLEKNKVMNLTAIEDEEEVNYKHFLDSILPLTMVDIKENASLIDIGTGAGFPAVPMKIMRPDIKMTLLDSLNKRINFLKEVNQELSLGIENLIHGRAEELGRQAKYREQFNIVIARAVSQLNTLSEYALPFVKPGGYFIAMKGPKAEEEIASGENAVKLLNGKIEMVEEYSLTGEEQRTLILIKKTGNTAKKYPRGGGKPKKAPL